MLCCTYAEAIGGILFFLSEKMLQRLTILYSKTIALQTLIKVSNTNNYSKCLFINLNNYQLELANKMHKQSGISHFLACVKIIARYK